MSAKEQTPQSCLLSILALATIVSQAVLITLFFVNHLDFTYLWITLAVGAPMRFWGRYEREKRIKAIETRLDAMVTAPRRIA